jgi:hypothetical protein
LQEKLTQFSLVSGDGNLYRRSAASILWSAMVLHCQLHVWHTYPHPQFPSHPCKRMV